MTTLPSMAAGRARVGCSGWVYRDWRGVVYPPKLPQPRWFEHYATLFDTVELNATFYRLPPVSTARALGPTLGPTLVQLPPRWKRNAERLDEFLTMAPTDLRWAVELRNPTGGLEQGCDTYAYFNNDDDGHAVVDARWLIDRLSADGHSTAA